MGMVSIPSGVVDGWDATPRFEGKIPGPLDPLGQV